MSNYQQSAYLSNGAEYIGIQSPAQQYNRGIKLPLPDEQPSLFDQFCNWLNRKGIL